jgi:hypothetical protein
MFDGGYGIGCCDVLLAFESESLALLDRLDVTLSRGPGTGGQEFVC